MSNTSDERPGIGVAVLIWKDVNKNELLIGHGHSSKEIDVYALAGGHLESGETLLQGAIREAKEECGVGIHSPNVLTIYEFYNIEKKKQYVTVSFEGIWDGSKPVPEPGKRISWDWSTLDDALKLPLFESDEVLLNNVKNGTFYDLEIGRNVYGFTK